MWMKYGLLLLLFLSSCDCPYNSYGKVIDAETGNALDSVEYCMEGRSIHKMTGEDGKFEVHEITGFDCSCKGVVFKRTGYATTTVDVDNDDTVVIRLQR